MKRIFTFILTLVMLFSIATAFSSCGNSKELIIGYTDYAPMNYMENGKLIGFDTEFAEAVCNKIGMKPKFIEISWGSKYTELNSGKIDVIWNGFTANSTESDGTARNKLVDFSYAYMENKQAVVIQTEKKDELNSADKFKDKKYSVEEGSAGETAALKIAGEKKDLAVLKTAQSDALQELLFGKVDFAVIDLTMSKTLIGKNDYKNLMIVENVDFNIEVEQYAIGIKLGNDDLRNKINTAIKELATDGTLKTIAEKYGLAPNLVTKYE